MNYDYSFQLVIGRQDCDNDIERLLQIVTQAIRGGITVIQLREKITAAVSSLDIIALGKEVLKLLRPHNIPLLINDHVDIAKEIDADGVHLGQTDLPYSQAREILGPNKIIGISVSNTEELHAAEEFKDIDYFGVGPIFNTSTKLDAAPVLGLSGLKELRQLTKKNLIAIGGINQTNIQGVIDANADGVAVVSAICGALNPEQMTKDLKSVLKKKYYTVLTIAGSDSGGGAGIQADLKTFTALKCYGMSVITALTAQNTQGVQAVYAVDPKFIAEQLNSVLEDIGANAIKIGMLQNNEVINIVAKKLMQHKIHPIVLDPVIVAKDGSYLLEKSALTALKEKLLPLVDLITPNLIEAEALLDTKIKNKNDMEVAAVALTKFGVKAVLVKGGHLTSALSEDCLYICESDKLYWFTAERIDTKNTHGTGCTLSAAIAAFLAQGNDLYSAVNNAKNYLTKAIFSGKNYVLGKGYGPVKHF